MKRITISPVVSLVLLVSTVFVIFVYFTEFYYAWPDYAIGTRNDTEDTIHNGKLKLLPKGEDRFGVLSPRAIANYEDPRWPLPETAVLSFDDPTGIHQEIIVPSGVRKPFKGRLTIVLKKDQTGYYAEVERSPLER